jgi:hypothetical protein
LPGEASSIPPVVASLFFMAAPTNGHPDFLHHRQELVEFRPEPFPDLHKLVVLTPP